MKQSIEVPLSRRVWHKVFDAIGMAHRCVDPRRQDAHFYLRSESGEVVYFVAVNPPRRPQVDHHYV